MNTFYSIISATINPVTNENIAVGLLLSDGKKSLYSFSTNRLSLVKSLVTKYQYWFIRDYLKSFQTIIEKVEKKARAQLELDELKEPLVVSEPYINYMSIYGQNVITASSPERIDIDVNQGNFNKLFVKFIDKQEQSRSKAKKTIMQTKDVFSERVKDHFTADKELSVGEFPNLDLPVTVDLFGKNEQVVIAQFVDLERQINFIKTDLYDVEHIYQVIDKKLIFLISQEPDKKSFPQQHHLWQQTRKDSKYAYTNIKEVDRIHEYAKDHGVVPN